MKKKPAWVKHQDEKPAKVTPAELTQYPEGREVMGCMPAAPMTDTKKRILPWKEADEHFYRAHVCMIAETSIGAYAIIDRGKYANKFAWMLEEAEWEYSKVYRYVDTIDAAIDACEADYVARCTEFLTLYNPATHVVVSRGEIKVIYDENCGECGIGRRKNPPCGGCCMNPIRAALEVK